MALIAYQEPTYEVIYETSPALPTSLSANALVPYTQRPTTPSFEQNALVAYNPRTSSAFEQNGQLVAYNPQRPSTPVSFGVSGALVPYTQPAVVEQKGGQMVVRQQQQTTSTSMKGGQLVVHNKQSLNLSSKHALVTTHAGDEIVPPHPVAPKTLKKQQELLIKSQPVPIAPNRGTLPLTSRLLKPYIEESYIACFLNQSLNLGMPGEVIEMTSTMGTQSLLQIGTGGVDSTALSYRLYFEHKRVFVVFRGQNDIQFPLREPDLVPIAGKMVNVNVHAGFYKALIPHMNNIIGQINANPRQRIVVTGFGNGGAIATVFYLALKAAGGHVASISLHTFGAPLAAALMTSTVTEAFKDEAWHYVLEGDPVPSLLGQRDISSVDQLLGAGNVTKKQGYNMARLKHYAPFGSYFYIQGNGTLVEPRGVHEVQNMLALDRRSFIKPQNHSVKPYLEALRNTVMGAF